MSSAERPPRQPKTREQASADNARKWNARQRAALPLFMQAGLEDQLVKQGLIQDRPADFQVRQSQSLRERLTALDEACRVRAALYQREVKLLMPARYPELLLKLRALRLRCASMRGPVNTSDYWYSVLYRELERPALLQILDRVRPEQAEVLRFNWTVNEQLKARQTKGTYNGWVGSS